MKCGEAFFWLGNGCLIWIWAPFMHFLDGLKQSATRWRHRLLPKAIEMSLIFLHLHLIEVEHFASYFNGDWNTFRLILNIYLFFLKWILALSLIFAKSLKTFRCRNICHVRFYFGAKTLHADRRWIETCCYEFAGVWNW